MSRTARLAASSVAMTAQKGSTLIVSLILLTSVTLLSLINMNISTNQIRIVTNLQTKETLFYTTRSEVMSKYLKYRKDGSSSSEMSLAIEKSTEDQVAVLSADVPADPEEISQITTTLRYRNTAPVNMNYAFTANNSIGHMAIRQFEISSITSDITGRYKATQLLGFTFQVPKS